MYIVQMNKEDVEDRIGGFEWEEIRGEVERIGRWWDEMEDQ